jgi:hypothetical protein
MQLDLCVRLLLLVFAVVLFFSAVHIPGSPETKGLTSVGKRLFKRILLVASLAGVHPQGTSAVPNFHSPYTKLT